MAVQIQIRRDTAANFTSANPVLAQGEWALETDTGLIKIGNGSTVWTSLAYFPGASYGFLTSATTFGGDISGLYNAIVVDKASQDFALTADVTITDTGTLNDYSLAATTTIVRWNGSTGLTWTGATGGADGRLLIILNVTAAQTLILSHDSASSSAANRFMLPNDTSLSMSKDSGAIFWYDSTSSRWRALFAQTGGGAAGGTTYAEVWKFS